MNDFFTSGDINELKENPSEYVKLGLISKIANGYNGNILSKNEKAVAGDILRLLAQDISTRIRMNISEKFCSNEEIPYDIVKKLADDIEDLVAIPVVQFSKLLTENDLSEIIKKDSGGKQRAVARRSELTDKLVGEIINYGSEHTAEALIDSNGKNLSESHSKQIISKFSTHEGLIGELLNINKVKPQILNNLLAMVSEDLRQQIVIQYNIPTSVVDSLVSTSKDSVAYSILKSQIARAESITALENIVAKLHREHQLSLNLIIKTLALGNLNFFLLALAKLANIPSKNVEILLKEDGNIGITKLFEKAHLSTNLANSVKTLYRLVEKEIITNPLGDIAEIVAQQIEQLANDSDDKHLRYISNTIKQG